jgi:hypothetical protein
MARSPKLALIQFQVPVDLDEAIKRHAQTKGLSVSAFCRDAVMLSLPSDEQAKFRKARAKR